MQILNEEKYVEYILDVTARLLAIDSPSGYTEDAARFVANEFLSMGYQPEITKKGGILVSLPGRHGHGKRDSAGSSSGYAGRHGGPGEGQRKAADYAHRRNERLQRRSGKLPGYDPL